MTNKKMWIRSLRPDRVKREGSQGQCPKKKKIAERVESVKKKRRDFVNVFLAKALNIN